MLLCMHLYDNMVGVLQYNLLCKIKTLFLQVVGKERPEWMKYSTVHLDDIAPGAPAPVAVEENLSASKPSSSGKCIYYDATLL